jgi:anthranilate phosphoribosyltransferase
VAVAKHGARAATSQAGSADVLTALGVKIDAAPDNAACCLNDVGLCFMFAPLYHQATARVARVRRELGVQTSFNLLGPLTNPAGAPFQLIGVYREDVIERVAQAVALLGATCAWVVHGSDGLDEITLRGETKIAEAKNGNISLFTVKPEDFGCIRQDTSDLRGGDAVYNATIIREVLRGDRRDAARDIVLLNSAAALYICGKGNSFPDSFQIATQSLESGQAWSKLEQLIETTNR